jgi:hypothetical protein
MGFILLKDADVFFYCKLRTVVLRICLETEAEEAA